MIKNIKDAQRQAILEKERDTRARESFILEL